MSDSVTACIPKAQSNRDDGRKNNWSVWRAVDKLELKRGEFYPNITEKVIEILKEWGRKWQEDPRMATTLNKSTLHHEIEESIVAINFLFEGLDRSQEDLCHVIDACAGKGMLSFLVSYLKHPKISSIVMLEKATIDWSHIEESNKTAKEEKRSNIEIWKNTNLHDYDDVLDRMLALPYPIAMCGIHLCKQLGPSFCGLYNGLGGKTIYGCLSPCCMPRAVTTQKRNAKKRKTFSISIQQVETAEERRNRRDYMLRRERLRKKVIFFVACRTRYTLLVQRQNQSQYSSTLFLPFIVQPVTGPCSHCQAEDHSVYGCTIVKALPKEEQISIRRAFHAATVPCWNCLEIGHFKEDCPNVGKVGIAKGRSSGHNAQLPPMSILDVTDVLKAPKPYSAYCDILAGGFQKHDNPNTRVRVIETNLEKQGNHDQGNWNAQRKSIFIVVD